MSDPNAERRERTKRLLGAVALARREISVDPDDDATARVRRFMQHMHNHWLVIDRAERWNVAVLAAMTSFAHGSHEATIIEAEYRAIRAVDQALRSGRIPEDLIATFQGVPDHPIGLLRLWDAIAPLAPIDNTQTVM